MLKRQLEVVTRRFKLIELLFNLDHEFCFVIGTEIYLFKAFPPPRARPSRALSIEQGLSVSPYWGFDGVSDTVSRLQGAPM